MYNLKTVKSLTLTQLVFINGLLFALALKICFFLFSLKNFFMSLIPLTSFHYGNDIGLKVKGARLQEMTCHAPYKVGGLVLGCRNCVGRSKAMQALNEGGDQTV